ncbi:aromatic-ring-hydroxylating dioxygenase subunit beta [Dactylosporangium sp. CA-092794]|uniref:aromatic-ring-hydroxylating dioxygenase subunit beta n=1 Tax=Dactylosporangium sp. CA-092794 TaxID=3239929 RepID=UPI003D9168A5
MNNDAPSADQDVAIRSVLLQHEVEQFYYHEAGLLDSHRYDEWVRLFTDDTHYFMPLRRTMPRRQLHREFDIKTGKVLGPPATVSLRTHEVRIDGTDVLVVDPAGR